MEQLIEKAVAKFGKEKVLDVLEELNMVSAQDDHQCDTGYYWSETLQKCVLDIGGHGGGE